MREAYDDETLSSRIHYLALQLPLQPNINSAASQGKPKRWVGIKKNPPISRLVMLTLQKGTAPIKGNCGVSLGEPVACEAFHVPSCFS